MRARFCQVKHFWCKLSKINLNLVRNFNPNRVIFVVSFSLNRSDKVRKGYAKYAILTNRYM